MLDQLDVQPGSRVLKIGSPNGYSATLLSVLAGRSGTVVTTDPDPATIRRNARAGTTCATTTSRWSEVTSQPDHTYPTTVFWCVTRPASTRRWPGTSPTAERSSSRSAYAASSGRSCVRDRDRSSPTRFGPFPDIPHTPGAPRCSSLLGDASAPRAPPRSGTPSAGHGTSSGPGVTLPVRLLPCLDLPLATMQMVYSRLHLESAGAQRTDPPARAVHPAGYGGAATGLARAGWPPRWAWTLAGTPWSAEFDRE